MKKTIVGIIIMLLAFTGIFAWEMFGREQVVYTEVVVLNQNAEAYTTITQDMLAVRKVYQPIEGSLTTADLDKVVGKQTVQFVPKAAELQARFFADATLVADKTKDEYVYSLSANTLKAYPRSLAKGDTIGIYCGENFILNTTVLGLRDANGNEVIQAENRTQATGVIASVEILTTQEQASGLSYLLANSEPLVIAYN